jgi:iron(III) transport system permease protein
VEASREGLEARTSTRALRATLAHGRTGAERLPVAGAVALVGFLALVPVGYLAWETFQGAEGLGLQNFRAAYRATGLAAMAADSLVFAAGSTALAVVSGTALAFLVVRTDLPLRRLVFLGALVPFIVPGILYTIAWILIASPRIGLLSDVLPFGFDVFGFEGMIVVEGLHLSPLVFLLVAAALRAYDPVFEDAARMSGARPVTVVRRVTLPLIRPALYASVLIMAIRALESFETPVLLGIPARIRVFTSAIWRELDQFPADFGVAGAYALPLLLVTAVGVFFYSRLAERGSRYETITSRGYRSQPIALGRWRYGAALVVWAYLLVAAVLPLAVLVYASTRTTYLRPSLDRLSEWSFASYRFVLSDDATFRAAGNSLFLAVTAATSIMVVMAAVAWFLVRGRGRARWLVDAVASLPLVLPGLVLGVALMVFYLRVPVPVYGTIWILLLAYVTRFMPYGLRYATAATHQVSGELEEAARTSGARWGQTFRRVTLPLLLPGLAAGWIYVAVISIRELSSSILLYSPGSEVLSVRMFVLYESGQFPELAALGVLTTLLVSVLVALAFRLGGRVAVWRE